MGGRLSMSACFSINGQLLCCGSEAWAVSHYFRLMLQGEIPKDSDTNLNYVYTEEERKNGYSYAFQGNISYMDLVKYSQEVHKFFLDSQFHINVQKTRNLSDFMQTLWMKNIAILTFDDVTTLRNMCNEAIYTPEPNNLFSNDLPYNAEFWEFVEIHDYALMSILKDNKDSTYHISFDY